MWVKIALVFILSYVGMWRAASDEAHVLVRVAVSAMTITALPCNTVRQGVKGGVWGHRIMSVSLTWSSGQITNTTAQDDISAVTRNRAPAMVPRSREGV